MSTFKNAVFVSAGLASIMACALPAATAQSLPVPMPIEEQRELEDARMRQQFREEFAGTSATFQQGIPLGRSSVAAQQQQQAYQQTSNKLQTLAPDANGYTIKAGSFRSFENAQRLHAKLYSIGSARIVPRQADGMDFYGVYLGPWATEKQAFQAYTLAMDAGMQDGQIIDPK